MTLRTSNRIRDVTTTTGTGTLTVSGTAPMGYGAFTSIPSIATNDTYYILIAHQTLNEWEVCLGTHASSTTISRGAVESSSNAGAAVSFSAGTKDVILVQTSGHTVVNTSVEIASGGAINFAATDVSIVHSAASLTLNGLVNFIMAPGGASNECAIECRGRTGSADVTAKIWASTGGVVFLGSNTAHDVLIFRNGTTLLHLTATVFRPESNDLVALGDASNGFSDAFFASGGVLNWNNGNYTLTHSAGNLTAAGGPFTAPSFIPNSTTVPSNGMYLPAANTLGWAVNSAAELQLTSTALSPTTNGGLQQGTTALGWGTSLYTSGAQLNFNNGDMTLTHSTDALSFDGGKVYFFSGNGFVCTSNAATGTQQFDGFTPAPQILSNFQDTASLAIGCWTSGDQCGRFMFGKSLSATLGTNVATTTGTDLGVIQWCAADGASTLRRGGEIRVETFGGTTSTTSVPTKMYLITCAVGSTGPADGITLDNTGAVRFPRTTTTATAANAFIDNADGNNLLRSTSSIRFKKDITAIPQARLDAVSKLRPVEFSSLASADDPAHRFVGYVAEEVAEVDPSLVMYGYDENDMEPFGKTSMRPKYGARLKPDGVQYDRVLMLQVVALQQRLAALEARGVT